MRLLLALFFLSFQAFGSQLVSSEYTWKSLFLSGDNTIVNFDRARVDLSRLMISYGADPNFQLHYSVLPPLIDNKTVYLPTYEALAGGMHALNVDPQTDGCLIHMTSHGIEGKGLSLKGLGHLTPSAFDLLVDSFCKEAPTVILVSACYSGEFLSSELEGDNRIILTASRKDLPSFGCLPETKYTYWDACLIENLPASETWQELYQKTTSCISSKEEAGGIAPSEPQAYFGKNVKDLRILQK